MKSIATRNNWANFIRLYHSKQVIGRKHLMSRECYNANDWLYTSPLNSFSDGRHSSMCHFEEFVELNSATLQDGTFLSQTEQFGQLILAKGKSLALIQT